MPTITAITLDRLLEPGASKSTDGSVHGLNHVPKPEPKPIPKAKTVRNPNLERRNSTSAVEKKAFRPPMSPALYATPEPAPLPDSPTSSFPPSPYIVNHKRRGPRLLKSFSEVDVAARNKSFDKPDLKVSGGTKVNPDVNRNAKTNAIDSPKRSPVSFTIQDAVDEVCVTAGCNSPVNKNTNGVNDAPDKGEDVNCFHDDVGSSNTGLGNSYKNSGKALENDASKFVSVNLKRDVESEDFFDPQDSMSYTSNTDNEDNANADTSGKFSPAATAGEFFDAWEELSSGSGYRLPVRNAESELREMRLSLLMEIEKRKQAEEALSNIRAEWQRISQQLSLAGLTLPSCPIASTDSDEVLNSDPIDLCQQLYVARLVSESIGKGIAKAEMEIEMETQLEAKNFEIARLLDRLHYYEAMNQEMSQRNQEAVEMARRNRQARKRRQRWVWGSIATAITVGTAALAWSYLPAGNGSPASHDPVAPEHDQSSK